MRLVFKRLPRAVALLALVTMLTAPGAFAAPRRDDGGDRWRSIVDQVKRLVVKALDDCRLSFPPG